jgi:hypothetical protein
MPIFFLAIALLLPVLAHGADKAATPNPALVAQYESSPKELNAKLAECKAQRNIVQVLADASCMSAQEVINRRQRKLLESKCSAADTFVYVPPDIKADRLEEFLAKRAPAKEKLEACGLTKEQWVKSHLHGKR